MHPVIVGAGRVRQEVEALRKLHWVWTVVDKKVAADRDQNAVRLHGHRGLAVAGDDLMLHPLERELL